MQRGSLPSQLAPQGQFRGPGKTSRKRLRELLEYLYYIFLRRKLAYVARCDYHGIYCTDRRASRYPS